MRISLNWLKRFVDLKKSPDEIAKALTSVGLEVESIIDDSKKYNNFVVGKILNVERHPNADKLSICKVQVSKGNATPLQIVCGAPNVKKNQKVVVGLVGAIVPKNQYDENGNSFELTNATIRGIESNGMICSEYELDFGNDSDGILVLENKLQVGAPISKYFGNEDIIFELGVTPNRSDCLSHIGVARELAAYFNKKLNSTSKISFNKISKQIDKKLNVEIIDEDLCPRYSALVIKNIEIKDSPKWLQNYLLSAAVRPINSIVDVTNFVMLELGQPMHAFDYDLIAGKKIKIHTAYELEHFYTLDGKLQNLSSNDLMICDSQNSIAIAGVMGGQNSAINLETKNIILESAYFVSTSVRKTSKKLSISTDASQRFERGTDPNNTTNALKLAAELISEISPNSKVGKIIDKYPAKIKPLEINFRVNQVEKILGVKIEKEKIISLLKSVEFKVEEKNNGGLKIIVPTFRPDVVQEIDIIEEVARLNGYDNIPNSTTSEISFSTNNEIEDFESQIKSYFSGIGFNEIVTNSFISEKECSFSDKIKVKVINPISDEITFLRPTLISSISKTIKFNINYGNKNLKLFEVGKIYFKPSLDEQTLFFKDYSEEKVLVFALSGNAADKNNFTEERLFDIFDLKGVVQNFFNKFLFNQKDSILYNVSENGAILIEQRGKQIGKIFKTTDEINKFYDFGQNVFVAELYIEKIIFQKLINKKYLEPSRYPKIVRDIAIVIEEKYLCSDIINQIKTLNIKDLVSINLFDLFVSDSLGKGKKSFAFRFEFQSDVKTLKENEIEKNIEKIIESLKNKFKANLRSQ